MNVGSHIFSNAQREERSFIGGNSGSTIDRSPNIVIEANMFFEFIIADKNNNDFISHLNSLFGDNCVSILENSGLFYKISILSKKGDTNNITIGKLFGLCDKVKTTYKIEYYSVNQTTMEQIFQTFAKETKEDHDKKVA